jgi:hypothetical protein
MQMLAELGKEQAMSPTEDAAWVNGGWQYPSNSDLAAIADVISADPQGMIVNSNLAQQAGFSTVHVPAAVTTSPGYAAAAAAAEAAVAAPASSFVVDYSAAQQNEIAALLAQLQLSTTGQM